MLWTRGNEPLTSIACNLPQIWASAYTFAQIVSLSINFAESLRRAPPWIYGNPVSSLDDPSRFGAIAENWLSRAPSWHPLHPTHQVQRGTDWGREGEDRGIFGAPISSSGVRHVAKQINARGIGITICLSRVNARRSSPRWSDRLPAARTTLLDIV